MSVLTTTFPVQNTLPHARLFFATLANTVRSLLGLGLVGARVAIKPSASVERRMALRRFRDRLTLDRMANEVAATQPNLAAELRLLAGRD